MNRPREAQSLRMTQQQPEYVHANELESPQRLHHPTPIVPRQPYSPGFTSQEPETTYTEQQDFQQQHQQHYSASIPGSSSMSLAAVTAAAEPGYTQSQYIQEGDAEVPRSPIPTEAEHPSPGTKRLFIHPYRNQQVVVPTSETSAPSASSTAGTFSTHDPPTPGPAPPTALDLASSDKTTAIPTAAPSAYGSFIAPLAPQQHHNLEYPEPPQTAPLPFRKPNFEDTSVPPTPVSAHTNLHYSHFQPSAALIAAAQHHSSYPGEFLRVTGLSHARTQY